VPLEELSFLFNVFVCSVLLLGLVSGELSKIWEITGGQIGLGSCYNIVTEEITFPGFEYTYNDGNTITAYGQTYQIPDNVYGYNLPVYLNDSRMSFVDSFSYYYKEYVSTWGISAGASIDGVDLSIAFSHTHGQINAMLEDSVNFFAENVLLWTEFHLEMWPGATVSPKLLAQIDKLPETYDDKAYLTFIEYFGTHLIYKTEYGAIINFTAVFASKLVNSVSIDWVKNQVDLTIKWMEFNAGINWNNFSNKTKIDAKFLENSHNVTQIMGGQPGILQASGFKAWWKTVEKLNAVIFPRTTAKPLYEIATNPKIAANLKKAIIAYGNGKLKREDDDV